MSAVITATHLQKSFGKTKVLDNLSLTIEKGSITGLIGPNGAGKTTTLKAILGLTDFSGELEVLGMDPRHGRHRLMEKVSFIADVGVLPRWLKVTDAVDFVEGVHPRFSREKALRLLAETSIGKTAKVSELSKGMITQLHLSLILAIDAELLVLDEPTLGLDILYQKEFFDRILNDYYDQETTIVISTHQVEEVRSVLTDLVFIDEGRIVLNTSMEALPETWCAVTVSTDKFAQAEALGPIHVSSALGAKTMLFENVAAEQLEILGMVRTPTISELLYAKMQNRGRQDI
jgi:ABC-2 type transport system ATP-binding protein